MAVCGSQFKTGDQGNNQYIFWKNKYRTCPVCEKQNMKSEDHVAGCRMNGDAYGTTVYTCKDCGWNTSFEYDDAAELYYYGTAFFVKMEEREQERARMPKDRTIDGEYEDKFKKMLKRFDTEMVRRAMIDEYFEEAQVDAFIAKHSKK